MMKQKTVILGLSGGVDSSVAALLLKKQNYKVIGVFMKNFSDTKNPQTGECSWREEKRSAQKIAALLEIPLITIDYEKEYKNKVIKPMFRDYKKNLTPNPDILCNKMIKFPALWNLAKKFKADNIATGHYARIKKTSKGYQILKGKDREKDQSYFLCELTQKDLSHTLFPVGNLTKTEVRTLAKKNKFPNWDKKGTSGICFVGKIDMKQFLKRKIKEKIGKVLSPEGETIGSHPGAMFFTIGERIGDKKGFEISRAYRKKFPGKLYVAEKVNNALIIAPEKHPSLKKNKVFIKKFHLINPKEKIPKELKARIRHLGKLHAGKLKSRHAFQFNKPIEGIAEGQSIVLYKGNQLIASGEIRLHLC